MLVSAEIRWFWRDQYPRQVREWFFSAGLFPGGGHPRTDKYLVQPNNVEIGIKERGEKPGCEVKGLIGLHDSPALSPLVRQFELWCKWSCADLNLNLFNQVVTTKTRWLRKFDTSQAVRAEIPLCANEQPAAGYSLPDHGCNMELTEVKISGRSDVWWTLGFEAFGDFEMVSTNLMRAVLPEIAPLASIVSSAVALSYPGWLSARVNESIQSSISSDSR